MELGGIGMVAIGSSRGQLAEGAEFILTSIEDKAEFRIKAPGIWVVDQLDHAYVTCVEF